MNKIALSMSVALAAMLCVPSVSAKPLTADAGGEASDAL